MKNSRRTSYLFTAVALVFSATLASAQVWNHDPESPIGPHLWGSLAFPFATCGAGEPVFVEVGKRQSPVDIVLAETIAAGLPALAFHYQAIPFVVTTTGHDVRVNYASGSSLRVGQDEYELKEFHFHAPSEHTVNGEFANAEIHLVHQNALLDLAAVGVLVKAVNVGSPVNPVIDAILRNASTESGDVPLTGFINAKDILPQFKSYYNYSGSLSTPPCTEGVRWFVLKEPVFVSQDAIKHLHEVISKLPAYDGFPDNNRPVRPLNGRVILNRNGK
jgi:carbonic anhydrase